MYISNIIRDKYQELNKLLIITSNTTTTASIDTNKTNTNTRNKN